MASITENLKKILAAVYGRDVRQAIHDGIAGCDENIKAECSNREKAEQEFATEIQNLEKKGKGIEYQNPGSGKSVNKKYPKLGR